MLVVGSSDMWHVPGTDHNAEVITGLIADKIKTLRLRNPGDIGRSLFNFIAHAFIHALQPRSEILFRRELTRVENQLSGDRRDFELKPEYVRCAEWALRAATPSQVSGPLALEQGTIWSLN